MSDSATSSYLRFDSITKTFPGVRALSEISFGVASGSVHALMGENGAGKSTLLRILSGAHRPTGGTLEIGGRPRVFQHTSESIAAGVAVIQQELQLVPEMSVAENIYLGHLPSRRGIVDRRTLARLARAQLEQLGETIDPDLPVRRLPIAQRQMVEIAKALSRGAKIVAFDEPTSSLSGQEVERLFRVIAELRQNGCAILYVSHRMEEIFQICDACTVLRDGRHVRTYETLRDTNADTLVRDMVGRDIADVYNYTPRELGAAALEVSNLLGPGITSSISLAIRRGEILGLFGLIGAGRTELLRLLFGAARRAQGEIRIHGRPVDIRSPQDAIEAGLVYCTEDRKKDGIVPILSVEENCNLSARRRHLRFGAVIDEAWERDNAQRQIEALNIKASSPLQLIKNLSGGNQQKVILGRWLSESLRVLLLDEPTRGIDVGAKNEIYQLIFRLAREGLAVVVVSSDLPEILGLTDRVAVMRKGALAAEFSRADATPEKVLARALP